MAIDERDGHHGSDEPVKAARIVWWIGMALLALLLVIAGRSLISGDEHAATTGDKAEAAH